MWVCRAGKNSIYYNDFIKDSCIYLPWEGFQEYPLHHKSFSELRQIVELEKNTNNKATVSNLASQLNYFCNAISVGDLVLVPTHGRRTYTLCRVSSDYKYDMKHRLPHSRTIDILLKNINRDIFHQSVRYSLGTYRTIFKVKDENAVLESICRHYKIRLSETQ